MLYRGEFEVEGVAQDTFLSTRGWGQGFAFVNGRNVGRYWDSAGPVHSLYVPAPLLRTGTNTLTILELDRAPQGGKGGVLEVAFVDAPDIDP
mmetsp:Transcript_13330/g.33564  ORF Transcript_13330/g.33564 Transcript_13330/m.33564 type:complete len:92 (+) Transcript_13330:3-278(+)